MKKVLLVILLLIGIFLGPVAHHSDVKADVCSGSPACNMVWLPYTWYSCTGEGQYQSCQWQTEMREVCQIPQVGGGACSCCWPDGCYLNCPGTNPGNTDPPVDTPAPGNTATPTPIPPTPTPVQYGTVRFRAALVPAGTNSCATVQSSTNYTAVNVLLFSEGTEKTTGTNGTYTAATWANSPIGTKSFIDTPPTDYVLALACWDTTSPAAQGTGYNATLAVGSTLTWQLGYTAGVGWYQAQGGDVYGATTLRSLVPSAPVGGRYVVLDGAGTIPGVVTYGSTYDFDSDSVGTGATYVSTKNWLVNETHDATDYYALLYHRLGSPTTADYAGGTTLTSKLVSREDPYYVTGDLTVDTPANWTVGNNETITVLVNGNLTIKNRINITGTGFIAFIVNGNITIDSTVGTTFSSSTPVVEGIYITSPAGSFITSASTTAGARRFVGKGTFVAGGFSLGRDLEADSGNTTYAAELFIYNPELLIRMPEKMKDLPVSWQEVEP